MTLHARPHGRPAPLREGDTVEVEITGVDDEGRGRGHVPAEGAPLDVAVRGALPGDRVQACLERLFAARGLAQARVIEHVRRGPLHVERSCPHRAPCPGCPLEGVDEGFARALKRARIVRALEDADLAAHVQLVGDVVASLAPRQKVKLTAGGRAGALRFGLFVPHSHVLVGAEHCPHQDARIAAAIDVLGPALQATGLPPATDDPTGVKALVLRVFREGTGAVVVVGAPMTDAHWAQLSRCVRGGAEPGALASLAVRVDRSGGNSLVGGDVERRAGPAQLTPLEADDANPNPESVDAFCQTDPLLAAWLYRRVAELLVGDLQGGLDGARFADLYAGTGGFSRALRACGARHIVAVERAAASASALAALDVQHMELSVEAALPALRTLGPLAGIVVDPPKAGMQAAAIEVAALGARRVALVACDPDAGARDARTFVDAGYTLTAVEPIDLFPATPEVETLFVLERSAPAS